MPTHITFQGQSWDERNTRRNPPSEIHVTVEGVDLDYGVLTVYVLGADDGDNLTLATLAPYTNEDGVQCGQIGWKLTPDDALLNLQPDLWPYAGLVYGRPIITSGDMPVDRWNPERPSFTFDADAPEKLTLGKVYKARDLPPGVWASSPSGRMYKRCHNIPNLMLWDQPIPGSEDWLVTYAAPANDAELHRVGPFTVQEGLPKGTYVVMEDGEPDALSGTTNFERAVEYADRKAAGVNPERQSED